MSRKNFSLAVTILVLIILYSAGVFSISNFSENIRDENAQSNLQTTVIEKFPFAAPVDPLTEALTKLGFGSIESDKISRFIRALPGLYEDYMVNKLQDIVEEELANLFPSGGGIIKIAGNITKITTIKAAGDAFNNWYLAHTDPNSTLLSKSYADIQLYEKGMNALASILPPGLNIAAVGIIKINSLTLQASVDQTRDDMLKAQQVLAQITGQGNKVMQSTLQQYGTTTQNKQLIISVMTDDQIIDYALGVTKGPNGENLQSEPDPSILNYVSGDKRKSIYKKMITKISAGSLDATTQQVRRMQKNYPVGSAVFVKNSPLYMLITDPSGRKFGVAPQTKDIICEGEEVFCSPLLTHYAPQFISTPALHEGTYEVKLFGFDDGEFIFSFIGINDSYKVESAQDINGFIKKGEILNIKIEITRTENGFAVNEIKFEKETESFLPDENAEVVPFKVVSISPDENSIFRMEKPVIKVVFNKPISQNNDFDILKNSDGRNVDGFALIDDVSLIFIPAKPLPEGKYFIDIKNLHDDSGVKLLNSANSSLEVIRKIESGLKFSLSEPTIYKITSFIKIKNNSGSEITNIKIKEPLFKDRYPNLFAKYLEASIEPAKTEKDSYGNSWATWEISSLAPNKELIIDYNFLVLVFEVNYFDFVDFENLYSTTESSSYSEFLEPFECIESSSEQIKETARKITKNSKNTYEKAQSAYYWTIKNVKYQYANEGAGGGAIQTLNTKKAVCHGYTCLYASFLRTLGIPTKYVLVASLDANKMESHAINEFLLPGYGWVPVDTTWGKEVNDWFLVNGVAHVTLGELYPPDRRDWLSFNGNLPEVTESYGVYKIVEPTYLWKDDLNVLYNSVDAISFKEKMFELLPQEIEQRTPANKQSTTKGFNIIDVEYVYLQKPYTEFSNSLDNEMLIVQEAVDDYFKGHSIDADTKSKLEENTNSIYSKLILEERDLVEQSKQDFNALAKESKSFILASDTKEIQINLLVPDMNEIQVNLFPENTSVPLQQILQETDKLLLQSEENLQQNDYEAVKNNLTLVADYLSEMEQTKILLSFNSLQEESILRQIQITDINQSADINIEKYFGQKFSSTKVDQESAETILIGLAFLALILILVVLWVWMLINCLFEKSFKHLNKPVWLLIIFLSFLFLFLGAVFYFFLEYLPKKRQKKKESLTNT